MNYSIKKFKIELPLWLQELLKKGRYKEKKKSSHVILKIQKGKINTILNFKKGNVTFAEPFFYEIDDQIFVFDGDSQIYQIKVQGE